MRSCNFVREEAIGLVLKLIHHYPKHSAACFASATACCLHDSQIATSADCETGLSQEFPYTLSLSILNIRLHTLGTSEDCYDTFRRFHHLSTSPASINDPIS